MKIILEFSFFFLSLKIIPNSDLFFKLIASWPISKDMIPHFRNGQLAALR